MVERACRRLSCPLLRYVLHHRAGTDSALLLHEPGPFLVSKPEGVPLLKVFVEKYGSALKHFLPAALGANNAEAVELILNSPGLDLRRVGQLIHLSFLPYCSAQVVAALGASKINLKKIVNRCTPGMMDCTLYHSPPVLQLFATHGVLLSARMLEERLEFRGNWQFFDLDFLYYVHQNYDLSATSLISIALASGKFEVVQAAAGLCKGRAYLDGYAGIVTHYWTKTTEPQRTLELLRPRLYSCSFARFLSDAIEPLMKRNGVAALEFVHQAGGFAGWEKSELAAKMVLQCGYWELGEFLLSSGLASAEVLRQPARVVQHLTKTKGFLHPKLTGKRLAQTVEFLVRRADLKLNTVHFTFLYYALRLKSLELARCLVETAGMSRKKIRKFAEDAIRRRQIVDEDWVLWEYLLPEVKWKSDEIKHEFLPPTSRICAFLKALRGV